MKIVKTIKWVALVLLMVSAFTFRSAMADMMDLYMSGILPSIVGSTEKIAPIPTDLGFEKPASLQ